jgi:hypothetical protein
MTQISSLRLRVLVNAMKRPSGDHAGAESLQPRGFVSARAPLPSALTTARL